MYLVVSTFSHNDMGTAAVPGKMVMPMSDEESRLPPAPEKVLSAAAQRALAEAESRRAALDGEAAKAKPEKGGRGGLDPVRYGDWEIKGLTADF